MAADIIGRTQCERRSDCIRLRDRMRTGVLDFNIEESYRLAIWLLRQVSDAYEAQIMPEAAE